MDGEIWAIAAPGAVGSVDVRVFVRGATNFSRTVSPSEPVRLLPAGIPTSELVVQNLGSITIEIGNDRSLIYGQGLRIAPNSILSAGAITPGGPGSAVIESFAKANLPAPGQAGRLVRLTDYDRGLWMDDGTQWRSMGDRSFDVTAFGAKGDGIADDGPAISSAIAAAAVQGGVVFIPPSDSFYRIATLISLDDVRIGVRIVGTYGTTAGKAELRWVGAAGSGPMIRGDSMASVHFLGLRFSYTDPTYDGDLVKASHSGSGIDIAGVCFEDCEFHGSGATGARTLLSLSAIIISSVLRCAFNGANRGIRLSDPAYGAATQYSDSLQFKQCTFNNCTRAITLGGSNFATAIEDCTFEPNAGGQASGVDTVAGAAGQIAGVSYRGNWHGDVNANGGLAWISLGSVALRGVAIEGNFFGTPGAGAGDTCIRLGEAAIPTAVQGAMIAGNEFDTVSIDFAAPSQAGVTVLANRLGTNPTNEGNVLPGNYLKAGNTVGATGNVRGGFVLGNPSGSELTSGVGVPSNALGANGDFYLRQDGAAGAHLYFKAAGAWAALV